MDMNNNPFYTVMECLSDDYEFLGLINLHDNTVTGYRFSGIFASEKASVGIPVSGPDFDRMLRCRLPEEDTHAFLQSVNREHCMEIIESGSKVTVPCRFGCPEIYHFAIEFAPNRQDRNLVAMAIRNVEEVVRKRLIMEETLEQKVREQTDVIQQSMNKLMGMQNDIIESMATLVESRDINTGNHIQNTRNCVSFLVYSLRKSGVFPELNSESYARNIIVSSVLHDIGKIFVSDMILNKPGKLTSVEFEIIRSHTTLGKEIVDEVFSGITDPELVRIIGEIVYSHHEKWDGTGYPQGLAGDAIPLPARIMAVADVLDALVSVRSYKEALSFDEAISIIVKDSGKHFDRRIVDALIREKDTLKEYLSTVSPASGRTSLSGAYSTFTADIQDKSIVSAFIADYVAAGLCSPSTDRIRSVYYKGQSYDPRSTPNFRNSISTISMMFGDLIHPDDNDAVAYAMSREGMLQLVSDSPEYTLSYRYLEDGEYRHRQLSLIRISADERSDSFDVLLGIRDTEEEVILSSTTEQCISALIDEENIDAAIGTILRSVTDFYKGDRAYIYTIDEASQTAFLKNEYVTSPELRKIGITKPIPLSVLQYKLEYMAKNGIFSSFETSAALNRIEQSAFSARMPKSLFIAPVIEHGKMTGFWGIDNPTVRTDKLSLLKDLTYTVSEAVEKAAAMEQIRNENELIRALVTDYGAIYRVNLVTRKVDIYGLDELAKKRYEQIFKNPNFNLDAFIDKYYITPDVVAEDQDRLRKAIAVSNCKAELRNKNEFSTVFRVRRDGINSVYTEVKVFKAEETDGELTAVILAFKVVDDEIRHEFERIQALHRVSHDGLTGLFNRETFYKKVSEYLSVSGPEKTALLFLDVDDFKSVNIACSHSEGDLILIRIASELKKIFGDREIVGRVGGDKFGVFIPDTDKTSVYIQYMSFKESLRNYLTAQYPGVTITESAGCVMGKASSLNFDEYRSAADKAMKSAKVICKDGLYFGDI